MKAIETRYAGCRFRSRLEARWAVFFDAMEIKWEYEPEGFETSAGWYLPDFRVDPSCVEHEAGMEFFGPTSGEVYLEVKGAALTTPDALKLRAFACDPGEPRWVMALGPIPQPSPYTDFFLSGWGMGGAGHCSVYKGSLRNFAMYSPAATWRGPFRAEVMDHAFRHADRGNDFDSLGPDNARFFREALINKAFTAARSARFEHDETPA